MNYLKNIVIIYLVFSYSNREQNWVSFNPVNGWKAGSYDVKYYQLNDQLNPIAQTSFKIDQVID